VEDPGIVAAAVIVQITDTHLGPPGSRPYGFDTADHLRQVARTIAASELDPVAILLTGDLTDDGDARSYEHLRMLVAEELDPIAPVLMVVGNHDHRGRFREVVLGQSAAEARDDDPYYYGHDIAAQDQADLRIIMCDSYLAGEVSGRLGAEQLAWIDQQLTEAAGRTCIVALHHPSVPRGVPRQRDYLLEDREAFADVIGAHRVAAVLCGHSHIATSALWARTVHSAAPATAYLMDPTRRSANRSYRGAGYAVCTVREGRAVVNPVLLEHLS
jgi:Icc protein